MEDQLKQLPLMWAGVTKVRSVVVPAMNSVVRQVLAISVHRAEPATLRRPKVTVMSITTPERGALHSEIDGHGTS